MLTREQIERARILFKAMGDVFFNRNPIDELCDLALKALPPTQEEAIRYAESKIGTLCEYCAQPIGQVHICNVRFENTGGIMIHPDARR